jgi:hypothetical protein
MTPKEEPKQECPHPEPRKDYYRDGCFKCWQCGKIVVEHNNYKQETLEEFIRKSYLNRLEDCLSVDFEDGVKLGAKWQQEQDRWKTVLEETPPSNIELLVQSPEGIVHLSSWRESYNIFSCQDKSESSSDWKWKTI